MRKKQITIMLDDDLKELLIRDAAISDRSISYLINNIIKIELEKEEKERLSNLQIEN